MTKMQEIILKKEEKVSNENLEERVGKNTQSLSLISNQLDNIIKLLQSNESINEEAIIDIIEKPRDRKKSGKI